MKLKKIIHIADIHVRLLKRHDEYKACFETLYQELRNQDLSETAIVVAGDIVHSKTELSPEKITIVSDFLNNLANLTKTIVIAGNHDCLVNNKNRLDALTPIIENIKHPNLYYFRESGIYEFDGIDFYVWSIIGDKKNWPKPKNDDKTKICLFHGPVHNAQTDVGYVVTSRHVMLDDFDGFNMVLLGDIHRHQVLQEYNPSQSKPIVVYAGSLIQQNQGENINGHGWCEWDVESNSFNFHELHNDYGFYTLRIVDGNIPIYHSDMPKNVHLRIISSGLEDSELKKLVATIRNSYNVVEVAIQKTGTRGKSVNSSLFSSLGDIAEHKIRRNLLNNWLTTAFPNIDPEPILELDKSLEQKIGTDDIVRNLLWIPISLQFSNLFTYGEENSIDFTKLQDIVGIFAPNAHGKTSVAEAICFALYDRTPRTSRGVEIMNTRKDNCYCEFRFKINDTLFTIERTGTRSKKGEVKIDVNFFKEDAGIITSLNAEERRYTNAVIRQYVGDYEDFILTTFSSSSAQGLFVDRQQSDRKDLLTQFMGLNIFDKLHYLANDESKNLAAQLKSFKSDDFTQQLVNANNDIHTATQETSTYQYKIEELEAEIENINTTIQHLYSTKIPTSAVTNIDEYVTKRNKLSEFLTLERTKLTNVVAEREKLEASLVQGEEKLRTKYDGIEDTFKEYNELRIQEQHLVVKESTLLNTIKQLEKNIGELTTQMKTLSQYEYDSNCKFCMKNGESTIEAIQLVQSLLEEVEINLSLTNSQRETVVEERTNLTASIFGQRDVEEMYQKLLTGRKWVDDAKLKISRFTNEESKIKYSIGTEEINLKRILEIIEEYENSKDVVGTNAAIDNQIAEHNKDKQIISTTLSSERNKLLKANSVLTLAKNQQKILLDKIKRAKELEDEFRVYDYYLKAVCRDGLPYTIISDILPELEVGVNDLLSQMVQFSVRFETDGKNVNMKIEYDDERIWPLQLASGMEKFITSLAIRVALTSISSLPKSNFLIIDEGLGTLDADNKSSLFMLFEVLRTQFDFIFLISHVDVVRDLATDLIEIDRKDGFSKIVIA
jgi:DNA repair exonuclease SbcCD ATPase subunit/predicted phosphodiesterase